MLQLVYFSGLLGLFVLVNAAKKDNVLQLPSYVRPGCSRNDPNINECVVRVGGPAIKAVVKGDPKYKIPVLDPLLLKEIRIQQGTKQVGLQLICTDCLMWGLVNANFHKAEVDWENRECKWHFTLDRMNITGKYQVSGQVLLLPITGAGDLSMTLENLTFSYVYDWTYTKRPNNYTYVVLGNSTFPFEVGNMKINLQNLFNGDKLLGGNMNRFLNENWRDIMKDLSPAFSKSLAQITAAILGNMAKVVPFDNMFPERYPL